MLRLKSSIIAFAILTLVIGVIAATSARTKGQGSAPSSKVVDVDKIPTVNVGNSPTVQAQQSGSWTVGIAGTANVNVANTQSAPVYVRDIDRPTAQPFQQNVELSAQFDNRVALGTITVPPGKLMVIEQVSGLVHRPDGEFVELTVMNNLVPEMDMSFIYLSAVPEEGVPNRMYVKSQQVRIYVDDQASIRLERNHTLGFLGGRFVISGYLVDK